MAHAGETHGHHDDIHSDAHMVKIWAILLVLLAVSIAGPMLEQLWITLLTAFGIAFIKAGLVVKHFMHLNIERPIVRYMLITCLVFMVLFFAGVSPDVMRHEGTNWENVAAADSITRAEKAYAEKHAPEEHAPTPPEAAAVAPVPPAAPKYAELTTDEAKRDWLMTRGATVYVNGSPKEPGSACASCHRADGTGYRYLAQSLVGAQAKLSDCKSIAQVIRQGTTAQLPTEGVKRKAFMPPFGGIEDQEIAAVATYMRNSWGNNLGVCTPEQVN